MGDMADLVDDFVFMPDDADILISATFVCKTDKAILVRTQNTQSNEADVWLPLSQISIEKWEQPCTKGTKMVLSVPEWLAYENGIDYAEP